MARFRDFRDVLLGFSIRDVIRHYGHAPEHDHKWKSFPKCPFCRNQDCAGVFMPKGGEKLELFKCHHQDCGGRPAVNAVGYVALAAGLETKPAAGEKLSPAAKEFLKIAGAWREVDDDDRAQGGSESKRFDADEAPIPAELAEGVAEEAWEPEPGSEEALWEDAEALPASPGTVPAARAAVAEAIPKAQESVGKAGENQPETGENPGETGAELGSGAVVLAAGGEAGEPGPTRGELALAALAEFHAAMPFTPEHEAECLRKRGLTAETCRRAGLRSSVPNNREAIDGLRAKYPAGVLAEAGLLVKDKRAAGAWKPNPKFCGWGVARVKPKAERKHDEDKREYGAVNPVVIPYYNEQGQVVALRPHKDSVEGDIARVYEPGRAWGKPARAPGGEEPAKADLGMITEGEFKALAWWQATGRPVLALPGIQQVRNLWPEIEAWMEGRLVGRGVVAVVFDNEAKDDPKLPGFKPNEWERHDAPKWGLYLARLVTRAGYDGRFGMLPEAWRDKNGKADWDGALAKLTADGKSASARREFERVAMGAVPEREFGKADLFESAARREILNGVAKLDYQWKLKAGHEAEKALAWRITRFCARRRDDTEALPARWRGLLMKLAQRYREVGGRYYICKAISDRPRSLLEQEQERARRTGDDEYQRMLALLLDEGMPEPVSNFTVKWHYTVVRSNGVRDRLVSLRNVHGEETAMVMLPAKPFSRPSEWRQWLLENGGFSWSCGERELQALTEDGCRMVAFKTVQEVASLGYHEASKLWFFGDAAVGPDGVWHEPDKHGIIWVRSEAGSQGYTLRRDAGGRPRCGENQEFVQGLPLMRPKVETRPDLAEFFGDVSQRLYETIGGLESCILLGMICSYAAMPELYARWTATPGLWVPGEQGNGKSSVARWLIRVWGFQSENGRPLPGSTSAKIRVALQQYSNLPLWLEEYQPGCEPWKHEILKNVLDRSPSMKIDMGDRARDILTSVLVTGVATCPDAQVKSRYAHVQVSARRRMADHFRWFEEHSGEFYQFGRALLTRRAEYVQEFQKLLAEWIEGEDMARVDARARLVHGVAWAGWVAAARMFKVMAAAGEADMRAFLAAHTRAASRETSESVNVNQFWLDVVSAAQQGAFGETPAEMRAFFKWDERVLSHPPEERLLEAPGATLEAQAATEWRSAHLYFVPQLVIEALRAHQRKHGAAAPPLERNDLMAQMKVKPYWEWARNRDGSVNTSGHRQRFAGKKTAQACWCINVDQHELGFVPCPDAEFYKGMFINGDPEQGWKMLEDRDDPRRGDLYVLGELLKRQEEER